MNTFDNYTSAGWIIRYLHSGRPASGQNKMC